MIISVLANAFPNPVLTKELQLTVYGNDNYTTRKRINSMIYILKREYPGAIETTNTHREKGGTVRFTRLTPEIRDIWKGEKSTPEQQGSRMSILPIRGPVPVKRTGKRPPTSAPSRRQTAQQRPISSVQNQDNMRQPLSERVDRGGKTRRHHVRKIGTQKELYSGGSATFESSLRQAVSRFMREVSAK